jgi:predicted ATPase
MTIPLGGVNIILGANGCGKTNLYQAISLIRAAAAGRIAQTLLEQGGLPSTLWAGRTTKGPRRIEVGVNVDDYVYDLAITHPPTDPSHKTKFKNEPRVVEERMSMVVKGKKVVILDRNVSSCKIRKVDGTMEQFTLRLSSAESVFDQIADPENYPALDHLRRLILKWRFYHEFRVDRTSPIRLAWPGVRTWALAADGSDLAAALQTIEENGDGWSLQNAFAMAFPGSQVHVEGPDTAFEIMVSFPGIQRDMRGIELSDGTMRYLCLLAALKSPRPAPLLVLNEPENSLHASLYSPLAKLLYAAKADSQLWVTTHSRTLAEELGELCGVKPIALEKVEGETVRAGRPITSAFHHEWDLPPAE